MTTTHRKSRGSGKASLISSYSKLYMTFYKMKDRCYNKKHKHYDYYGGRGITICPEWLSDKNTFFLWALENGYKDGLTIDRTDGNNGYYPSNCTWKSRYHQSQTTRLLHSTNTSGYRGVSSTPNNTVMPFRARIQFFSKTKHLGNYKTPIEAARAYDSFVVVNNLNHTINNIDLFNKIRNSF